MNDPRRRARILRAAIGCQGPIEPTQLDWNEWVQLARTERVLPLLYRVATTADNDLTEEQARNAVEIQLDVMGTMVRFEHDLLDVAQALTASAVPFAVIKGAATAHMDYPDPSLRQFADADLLVAPDDLLRACGVLEERGWRQAYPLPRHHERFTHAITLRNAKRVEIDLHQSIAHRAIGELIPTQDLLADAVEFVIADRSLQALSTRDRLIHAAIHALTSRGGYRRLSSTADVLVLSETHAPLAPAVLDRAESWKVRPLVEAAIRSAYSEAQMTLPDAWAAAMSSPIAHRDRLVEHAYLSSRRRPILEELAYLRVMNGFRNRALYLRGYFSTDADYAARNQRKGIVQQSRYLWSRIRSDASQSGPASRGEPHDPTTTVR